MKKSVHKTALGLKVLLAVMVLMLGLFAFDILYQYCRVYYCEIGIELIGTTKLARQLRDLSGADLWCWYEIQFGQDDYDNVMNALYVAYGSSEPIYSIESIQKDASNGGIPYDKYWMDPQKETVIWWHDKIESTTVVSQDSDGMYHAYIEWRRTPLWFMRK